ncbi:MAG: quinone-dependent dihydroorotate dehydrogenase, partial [Rikenellaceae bacterium]
MYKIIKHLLFQFSPETSHHLIMFALKTLRYVPFGMKIVKKAYSIQHPLLEREVFGMKFSNPVGMAAGFDKNSEVYEQLEAFGFGFIEVGTVTPKAQLGNPKPRLFRIVKDKAIINRMGFNNKGVDHVVANLRKRSNSTNNTTIIGGNLGKNTLTTNEMAKNDYLNLFRRLYDYIDYFVINISCPNIANLQKLQNSDFLSSILEGIVEFRKGQVLYRPILIKISPDLSHKQVDDLIEQMKRWNLDGIVATNTTTSREGLITSMANIEAIGNGGLSGA